MSGKAQPYQGSSGVVIVDGASHTKKDGVQATGAESPNDVSSLDLNAQIPTPCPFCKQQLPNK
eukprot:scaffold165185_cov21-Tisochrysis_lutea.AAC.1